MAKWGDSVVKELGEPRRPANVAGKPDTDVEDLNPERRLAVSDHTAHKIAVCQRLQTNSSRRCLIEQQCLFFLTLIAEEKIQRKFLNGLFCFEYDTFCVPRLKGASQTSPLPEGPVGGSTRLPIVVRWCGHFVSRDAGRSLSRERI